MDRNLNHPRDSKEALLAAFAGILPVIPNACGQRETLYLAKIQGQDVQLPETDRTRTEMYLRAIAEHGGGGSPVSRVTFTGNGERSIVVPELVGKTLIVSVLADNVSESEMSEIDSVGFLLFHTDDPGQLFIDYEAIEFPSIRNGIGLVAGDFYSEEGELYFGGATLPLGKEYIAFYQ